MNPIGLKQTCPMHLSARRSFSPIRRLALGPLLGTAQMAVVHADSDDCTSTGTTTTCTLSYTGSAQTWTVPAGVTQATFDAFGAQGGRGSRIYNTNCGLPGDGGLGGQATATVTVTRGTMNQLNVGGVGADAITVGRALGGFNGV